MCKGQPESAWNGVQKGTYLQSYESSPVSQMNTTGIHREVRGWIYCFLGRISKTILIRFVRPLSGRSYTFWEIEQVPPSERPSCWCISTWPLVPLSLLDWWRVPELSNVTSNQWQHYAFQGCVPTSKRNDHEKEQAPHEKVVLAPPLS